MTSQAFIILTPVQRDAARVLNRVDYSVEPVLIDNAAANGLGFGALAGLYVLPTRVLTDPNYVAWASSLGSLPSYVIDSASLFNPVTLQ